MSHRGVEIVLGRLIVDEAVRRQFVQAPAETLRELSANGLELNPVEFSALLSVLPAALQRFAKTLDPRLLKAALVPPLEDGSSGRDPNGEGGS
jgi:hypothetical protein